MKRVLFTLVWILTATVICSAQTTFYYPHVVNGVLSASTIWKTTIFLTNPASSGTASGTITFSKDNAIAAQAGSAFAISFTDESGQVTNGTINFTIPPGGARKFVSSGTGDFAGGFATVTSTTGTVNGTAIFSQFDLGNKLIAEAGVPAVPAVARQSIFVDTVGGFNIGVAYANPGTSAANVELKLLNSSAATVKTTTQTLGPGNHAAAFTFQMFPDTAELAGTMQILSSSPLSSIALRFSPNFGVFTTLPPVTLASVINPAVEWFEQRPWLKPLTSLAKLLGSMQLRIG